MPFDRISELPGCVRRQFGEHGQQVFRRAFNSAWSGTCAQRSDKEGCAFAVATTAAQRAEKAVDKLLGLLNAYGQREEESMEWQRNIQVIKLEHEQRVVRGVVLEPDVVDAQDDMMTSDEIEKAAHGFMIEVQRGVGAIGVDHEGPADAVIVESFLAPVEFSEGEQTIRKGSWMLAIKIFDDSLWETVKSGERTAFSIHGIAERHPVNE